MNNDLEEIKSRLNVVDVLGEYLRLEKAGTNWRALCPFHNEKSPSFMVSEEKQIWHCFGCQKGGDIFSFVMEMEGLEFKEALKILAEKAGVTLANFKPQDQTKKTRSLEILELATKFYETQLWKGMGKTKVLDYLKARGLKEEVMREFRLGYAPPGWRNIIDFLVKRGYSTSEIQKAGLAISKGGTAISDYYDRFRDRIMYPICDYSGKVVGYSARVAPGGDESQAKYINTPETEVYHKSKILYGIDKAKAEIKRQDYVLLVEGNMDVIAAFQAGLKNAIAVSGTALTEEQVTIIKRYTNNIKMFFDMDAAGEAATRKSIKLCLAREMNIKIVSISDGKDAADIAKENPQELIKEVKDAPEAVDYLFQKTLAKYDRTRGEGKKMIAQELLDIVSVIGNEIEKNHWLKKLSESLAIDERVLTDMLKRATLDSRTTKDFQKKGDNFDNFGPRKKVFALVDNLIGAMLASSLVWKEAVKEKDVIMALIKDSLLDLLLSGGEAAEFGYEKIAVFLDDDDSKRRAGKLFFERKFRLGLNNNIEEIMVDNPEGEFRSLFTEIQKEFKKEKLEKIVQELQIAKEKGDKELELQLKQKFKQLTQELASLI